MPGDILRVIKRDDSSSEPPTPQEVREQLAEAGDLAGLLEHILATPSSMLDPRRAFVQVQRAISSISGRSPAGFCQEIFRATLAFHANVLMRAQYCYTRALEKSDTRGGTPPEVAEAWKQLNEVQAQVMQIAQAWAATNRRWELAKRQGPSLAELRQFNGVPAARG